MIWAGMDEDKFLGPCKVCEEAGRKHEDGSPNRLRIIEMKRRQAVVRLRGLQPRRPRGPRLLRLIGPLPGRGYELWRLEERCSVCGQTPRLTVKGFRGRPWKLCLNDDCPSMVEMREKRAERERPRRKARGGQGGGRRTTKGAGKKDGAKPRRRKRGRRRAPTARGAGGAASPSRRADGADAGAASRRHGPRSHEADRPRKN